MNKIIDISFLKKIDAHTAALLVYLEEQQYNNSYKTEILKRIKIFHTELKGILHRGIKEDASLIVDDSYFVDILHLRNILYHIELYLHKYPAVHGDFPVHSLSKMMSLFDEFKSTMYSE